MGNSAFEFTLTTLSDSSFIFASELIYNSINGILEIVRFGKLPLSWDLYDLVYWWIGPDQKNELMTRTFPDRLSNN